MSTTELEVVKVLLFTEDGRVAIPYVEGSSSSSVEVKKKILTESEWISDEENGYYTYDLALCSGVLKIYNDENLEVALVDTLRSENGECVLRSLSPFDGTVLFI